MKTEAAAFHIQKRGSMVHRQTVEEFLISTRPMLRLLRDGRPLTQNEEDLIATKIGALRVEFSTWKKRRTRMPLQDFLMPPSVRTLARAEKAIIAEWRRWAKKRRSRTITDMQIFYFVWLKRSKPELLSFNCHGDQWQLVLEWLQHDVAWSSACNYSQGRLQRNEQNAQCKRSPSRSERGSHSRIPAQRIQGV